LKLKELETKQRKGVHPAVLAAVALIAVGGAAYGYFGVFEPARREAAERQALAERQAHEAAAERQRIAHDAADARAESERTRSQANDRIKAMEDANEKERAKAAQAAAAAAAAAAANTARPAPSRGPGKPAGTAKKKGNEDDPLLGLDGI
jgi:ATPase subunit of ABC transporter with duplicated ATPase domains